MEAANKMRSAAIEIDAALRQSGWAAEKIETASKRISDAAERISDSVDKLIEHDRAKMGL